MQPLARIDAKKRSGEIFLFAAIGDPWEGITAKAFGEEFAKLADVDELIIKINSAGGDVFQGTTIYNLIAGHKAKKRVEIVGIAASIASIIAMAGDEIAIARNGFMFIHDAQATAWRLNAAKLRRTADELDLVSDEMAATYARRSGQDPMDMRKMMRKEELLNAARTVELGLADGYLDPVAPEAIRAALDENFMREHKDVYDSLVATIGAPAPVAQPETQNSTPFAPASPPTDGPSPEELKDMRLRMAAQFNVAEIAFREIQERA